MKPVSKKIMSDELAQKVGRGVGRGGAGNFYTKADIENALHMVYQLPDGLASHEAIC